MALFSSGNSTLSILRKWCSRAEEWSFSPKSIPWFWLSWLTTKTAYSIAGKAKNAASYKRGCSPFPCTSHNKRQQFSPITWSYLRHKLLLCRTFDCMKKLRVHQAGIATQWQEWETRYGRINPPQAPKNDSLPQASSIPCLKWQWSMYYRENTHPTYHRTYFFP